MQEAKQAVSYKEPACRFKVGLSFLIVLVLSRPGRD
jgi:hypothetical protein